MKPPVEPRCSFCHAVVGKGKTHNCSKIAMQDNLHNIFREKSLKSKEKIGSKGIKHLFDDKGVSRQGGTVLLCTGGKKLPVSLSININKARFTHENLKRLQVAQGCSDRSIQKTAQAIRHVLGRKSVEPGFAESCTKRNKALRDHFEIKEYDNMKRKPLENEKGKKDVDTNGYVTYKTTGVVTPNFDALVGEVIDYRGFNPHETEVCCGLDYGQDFNKIGFIVKEKTEPVADKVRKGHWTYHSAISRLFYHIQRKRFPYLCNPNN